MEKIGKICGWSIVEMVGNVSISLVAMMVPLSGLGARTLKPNVLESYQPFGSHRIGAVITERDERSFRMVVICITDRNKMVSGNQTKDSIFPEDPDNFSLKW
jgi:hypothetical protein